LGFRTYYPAIGRFTAIDPLAEMFYSQSPYVYAANNPVRYIDFLGLAPMESQGWDDFPDMPDLHYIDMDGKFRLTVMPFDVNGINDGGFSNLGSAVFNSIFPMYWQSYYNEQDMDRAETANEEEKSKNIFRPAVLNLTVVDKNTGRILYHNPFSRDKRILEADSDWKRSDGFGGLKQIGTELGGKIYWKHTNFWHYDYRDNEGGYVTSLPQVVAVVENGRQWSGAKVMQKYGLFFWGSSRDPRTSFFNNWYAENFGGFVGMKLPSLISWSKGSYTPGWLDALHDLINMKDGLVQIKEIMEEIISAPAPVEHRERPILKFRSLKTYIPGTDTIQWYRINLEYDPVNNRYIHLDTVKANRYPE